MRSILATFLVGLCCVIAAEADEPRTCNGKTVEVWRQVLRDRSSSSRDRGLAITSLEWFGPEALAAVPELIEEARRGEHHDGAVDALAEIGKGTEVTVPNLIRRLVEEGSVHLTGTGSFGISLVVQKKLARIGEPAVPALRDLLKAPDRGMRVSAANVLGALGPAARAAVPDLLEIVERPAEDDLASCLLHYAIIALGRIGPHARAAVPALLRRIGDPAHEEDNEIVLALDRIGEPPVRKLLNRLLDDGDPESAVLLRWIGPKARDAVPSLRRTLDDPRRRVRIAAASALAGVDPAAPGVAHVLVDALEHPDDGMDPGDIVAALGQLGPAAGEAVPALIARLDHGGDGDDARGVAEAVVRIDPEGKRCVPALARALKHEDHAIAAEASCCLGLLGPAAKHAVPMLATTLTRTVTIPAGGADPRVTAARALRRIGPDARPAIPALIDALNGLRETARSLSGDEPERFDAAEAVAETLGAFGPAAKSAIPVLIDAARTREREDASRFLRQASILALGRIGPDARSVLPDLRRLMSEDDKGSIYQPEIVITFLRLDPIDEGPKVAALWLARPGIPRARAQVLGVMGRTSVEGDHLTRRDLDELDMMLGSAGPREEPSVEILEDCFDRLRRLGASARLAIPRLTEYRSHPNPWVRLLAAEALKEIRPETP